LLAPLRASARLARLRQRPSVRTWYKHLADIAHARSSRHSFANQGHGFFDRTSSAAVSARALSFRCNCLCRSRLSLRACARSPRGAGLAAHMPSNAALQASICALYKPRSRLVVNFRLCYHKSRTEKQKLCGFIQCHTGTAPADSAAPSVAVALAYSLLASSSHFRRRASFSPILTSSPLGTG